MGSPQGSAFGLLSYTPPKSKASPSDKGPRDTVWGMGSRAAWVLSLDPFTFCCLLSLTTLAWGTS